MVLIFVGRWQSGIAREEHRNSAENAVERQQKCLYYRSHPSQHARYWQLVMSAITGAIPGELPRLVLDCWMLSHPGYGRENNEDAIRCWLPESGKQSGMWDLLALVADGMGGHSSGEVASGIAAETILRLANELDDSPSEVLRRSFTAANAAIIERGRGDPACVGMGTTCTLLALSAGALFLAHVGDSRAYLLRDGRLHQLSEDDSLMAQMVRRGLLNEKEARHRRDRHILLHALGTEEIPALTVWQEGLPVQGGDAFLLCSDGLTNFVDDSDIASVIAAMAATDACNALCEAALKAGGTDNISLGVFKVAADTSAMDSATSCLGAGH